MLLILPRGLLCICKYKSYLVGKREQKSVVEINVQGLGSGVTCVAGFDPAIIPKHNNKRNVTCQAWHLVRVKCLWERWTILLSCHSLVENYFTVHEKIRIRYNPIKLWFSNWKICKPSQEFSSISPSYSTLIKKVLLQIILYFLA